MVSIMELLAVKIVVDLLLFDLDGTLVNSSAIVERSWANQVKLHNEAYPEDQIDLNQLLLASHGSRSVETFKNFFPYKSHEPEVISEWEKSNVSRYYDLGVEITGASQVIEQLQAVASKWAIVTSGTRDLAHGWFNKLFSKFSKPSVFITADDISRGKPNPDGYLAAFKQLSELNEMVSPDAIVFEDAPVGIQSGLNAGFKVIGIASTFDKDVLVKAGASYVIQDLTNVDIQYQDGRIVVNLTVL